MANAVVFRKLAATLVWQPGKEWSFVCMLQNQYRFLKHIQHVCPGQTLSQGSLCYLPSSPFKELYGSVIALEV